MREIITLCLGQAGNSVGAKFNEAICDDHGIDPSGTFMGESELQLERIDCYFQEGVCSKYVPRTLLVDLEPGTLEAIRGTRYGQTFRPDNFISSKTGAGNNFAKGFLTEGVEMLEPTFDAIRREVEASECLQGFQVVHSLGGGTGSGMGSLLLEMLKEHFSDRTIVTWSVMPSPQISEVVVEPYNSVLAAKHLIDASSFSVCVDNKGLYDIMRQRLRVTHPIYPDLNHLISLVMCGVTAAFRFPGQLNSDIRKFAVGLVPYPRLHFFLPGFVPLSSRGAQQYRSFNAPDLINEMFTGRNMYASLDPRHGKYITFAGVFRGLMSTRQVEELLYERKTKHSRYFAEWLPTNMKSAFCDIPPRGMKTSCSYLANTTVVSRIWERMVESFQSLFRKRAFIHWYLNEGMEEDEFAQAADSCMEMVTEYQMQEVDGYFLAPSGAGAVDDYPEDDEGDDNDEDDEKEDL